MNCARGVRPPRVRWFVNAKEGILTRSCLGKLVQRLWRFSWSWVLLSALTSLPILFVLRPAVLGSDNLPSVTDDCDYCRLYGTRFRTLVDLYLFQETGEPEYKYFGVSRRGRVRPSYLPVGIKTSHVGHVFRSAKILGVVPAGSEFVVEAATHDVAQSSGETLGLMCRLFYGHQEIFPVQADFIQIHTLYPDGRQNPAIDPTIAETIKK